MWVVDECGVEEVRDERVKRRLVHVGAVEISAGCAIRTSSPSLPTALFMTLNGAEEGLVSGNGAGPPRTSPDELIERVQRLTAALDEVADPLARSHAEELVSAVIELYGEGMEPIFAVIDTEPEAGPLRDRLQDDGVIASLMLIHDLYPVSLTDRVVEALDSVRPYMESHGGDVELLGVEQGIARIRLEGSCKTCPASQSTLELAIKSALDEAAPDLEGLVVEGPASPAAQPASGGAMELPVIQVAPAAAQREPAWFSLPAVDALAEGELTGAEIEDVSLVVGRVEGTCLRFTTAARVAAPSSTAPSSSRGR